MPRQDDLAWHIASSMTKILGITLPSVSVLDGDSLCAKVTCSFKSTENLESILSELVGSEIEPFYDPDSKNHEHYQIIGASFDKSKKGISSVDIFIQSLPSDSLFYTDDETRFCFSWDMVESFSKIFGLPISRFYISPNDDLSFVEVGIKYASEDKEDIYKKLLSMEKKKVSPEGMGFLIYELREFYIEKPGDLKENPLNSDITGFFKVPLKLIQVKPIKQNY